MMKFFQGRIMNMNANSYELQDGVNPTNTFGTLLVAISCQQRSKFALRILSHDISDN